jgi:CRP/FNR family transcriptional regulator, cyclic AMP receptor protein
MIVCRNSKALQWLNLKNPNSIPPLPCERRPGTNNHEVNREGGLLFAGRSRGLGFNLQKGRAKVTVVSPAGKQATIILLSAGDFVGEKVLAAIGGLRLATAIAITACNALRIRRDEIVRAMHLDSSFPDLFLKVLLERSMRIQADLVDRHWRK